jgi:hypothetical protein
MSSIQLLLTIALLSSTAHALPLTRRDMAVGAKAGLGVGIAVVAILVVGLIIFLIVHFRRARHINNERAILAGEKNADGSDKLDKFAMDTQPEPQVSAIPRRNKSVKDRLMGPLYRGSVIDMHPLPKARIAGGGVDRSNRASTMTMEVGQDGMPLVGRPFAPSESSPRPSFSSKRATRMMMMM